MNWFLKRKLKQLGRQGDPSPVFVRSLENKLRQQTGHPFWWVRWSRTIMATMSTLAITTSATGAYAYSSEDVLPDHPLYALRETIESINERVTLTPQGRAAVHQRNLQRHVHDLHKMEEKKRVRQEKEKEKTKKIERKELKAEDLHERKIEELGKRAAKKSAKLRRNKNPEVAESSKNNSQNHE